MTTTMQEYKERIEDAACILLKDTKPTDMQIDMIVSGLVDIVCEVLSPEFVWAIDIEEGIEICEKVSRRVNERRVITENFEPAYMGNYA